MLRSFFAVLVVLVASLVAACSSSTPTSTQTDCIAGTYSVSYTLETGDCGDITSSPSWTLTRDGDQYRDSAIPANATPTGGTFDVNTCIGQFGFTVPEGASACMPTGTAAYDLKFTSTGFTGSLDLADCTSSGDSGVATKCTAKYSVTGTRH